MTSQLDSSWRLLENDSMGPPPLSSLPEGDPPDAAPLGTEGLRLRNAALGSETILCVEDDRECSELLREELEERGFKVILAYDGRQALSLLQESKVDLIIADINMPEMSGFELLKELNKISSDSATVPFIFLTGLSDRESALTGRTLGADDYLQKPVDFDILQTIIEARLGGVARLRLGKPTSNALTDREIEALTWAARGKTRDEIAQILNIVVRTVEFHLDNAQRKLEVQSRIEAAVKATILGLIDP